MVVSYSFIAFLRCLSSLCSVLGCCCGFAVALLFFRCFFFFRLWCWAFLLTPLSLLPPASSFLSLLPSCLFLRLASLPWLLFSSLLFFMTAARPRAFGVGTFCFLRGAISMFTVRAFMFCPCQSVFMVSVSRPHPRHVLCILSAFVSSVSLLLLLQIGAAAFSFLVLGLAIFECFAASLLLRAFDFCFLLPVVASVCFGCARSFLCALLRSPFCFFLHSVPFFVFFSPSLRVLFCRILIPF